MLLRILDRYIVRSYLFAWVTVFIALLMMVILFDFVLNIDEFFKDFRGKNAQGDPVGPQEFTEVLAHIGRYYLVHSTHHFSLLAGFIAVIAAGFVLARMSHSNELTAVLASGVSLHRVLLPVAVVGAGFNMLLVADQELVMPGMRQELMLDRDDLAGSRATIVYAFRDEHNALLAAVQLFRTPEGARINNVLIIERESDVNRPESQVGRAVGLIRAAYADWEPTEPDGSRGRWKLEQGTRIRRYEGAHENEVDITAILRSGRSELLASGAVFTQYYPSDPNLTTDMSPEALRRAQSSRFLDFLSYSELGELAAIPRLSAPMRAELQTMRHLRITTPLTNMLLMLAAVPFFLTRERRNLIFSSAAAMALVGGGMGLSFMAGQWAFEQNDPHWYLVGAWIPVAIYAPLAVLNVDGIKT